MSSGRGTSVSIWIVPTEDVVKVSTGDAFSDKANRTAEFEIMLDRGFGIGLRRVSMIDGKDLKPHTPKGSINAAIKTSNHDIYTGSLSGNGFILINIKIDHDTDLPQNGRGMYFEPSYAITVKKGDEKLFYDLTLKRVNETKTPKGQYDQVSFKVKGYKARSHLPFNITIVAPDPTTDGIELPIIIDPKVRNDG